MTGIKSGRTKTLQIGVILARTNREPGHAVGIFLRCGVCPRRGNLFRAGAFVRHALRSVSVVRFLFRRWRRGHQLRISYTRTMPGNCKRHRWLLRAKSILQSATPGIAFTQALGRVTRMRGRGRAPLRVSAILLLYDLNSSLEKSHASSVDSVGSIYPSSDLGTGAGAGSAISL